MVRSPSDTMTDEDILLFPPGPRKLKWPALSVSEAVSKCRYSSLTVQVRANAHSTPAPATQPGLTCDWVTTVPAWSARVATNGGLIGSSGAVNWLRVNLS